MTFSFLFLITIIVFGVLLLLLLNRYDYHFLKKRSLTQVDRMSGFTFEKYLSVLFKEKGYHVVLTPDSADFGADLIVTKDNISTAIQAKRYKHPVGLRAVQEVVAARLHYRCQKAMVITNSVFSDAAWKLAKSNHVWLVDRRRLEQWIEEMKAN